MKALILAKANRHWRTDGIYCITESEVHRIATLCGQWDAEQVRQAALELTVAVVAD